MKVLLVEPDEACARKSCRIIEKVYYDVDITIVRTSYDATYEIRNSIYDLIIMEINLPDLRGDMIIGFAQEGFKLGMSRSHVPSDIRNRFDEFLVKPFSDEQLTDVLTSVQFQYLVQ